MNDNEEDETNDYFSQVFNFDYEYHFVIKSATTTAAIIASAYIVPVEIEFLLFNNEDPEISYYKFIQNAFNYYFEEFTNIDPNRPFSDEENALLFSNV